MIPWRRWFHFAVLSLGLAPEEFWALTLNEWRFLATDDGAALTRGGLESLIARYPDERAAIGDRQSAIGSLDHD